MKDRCQQVTAMIFFNYCPSKFCFLLLDGPSTLLQLHWAYSVTIVSFQFSMIYKTRMDAPASESAGADAILQPQGTKSGQNASHLSRNSPSTFFPPPETSSRSTALYRNPIQEQVQAIAALIKYSNRDIIAWHKRQLK